MSIRKHNCFDYTNKYTQVLNILSIFIYIMIATIIILLAWILRILHLIYSYIFYKLEPIYIKIINLLPPEQAHHTVIFLMKYLSILPIKRF